MTFHYENSYHLNIASILDNIIFLRSSTPDERLNFDPLNMSPT